MKNWMNTGTKGEVFVKKALPVLLAFNMCYRIGYVIGKFLANLAL